MATVHEVKRIDMTVPHIHSPDIIGASKHRQPVSKAGREDPGGNDFCKS